MSLPLRGPLPPSHGTVEWLHALTTARLNGKAALMMQDTYSVSIEAAAKGRCAVQLLEDNSTVSVRLGNLSLSHPSHFCIRASPVGSHVGLGIYATQDIAAGGHC